MNTKLLIEENFHVGLTLISGNLYHITQNKSEIWFHNDNAYNLFYIHLNEYLKTQFTSPLDNKTRVSLFELTIQFCEQYNDNDYFKKFITQAIAFKSFLNKKRIYEISMSNK